MTMLGSLLLLATCAPSAETEALRARVDCMFEALEAKERGGRARACPKPVRSEPAALAPPAGKAPPAFELRTGRPGWLDRLPSREGFLFGVGTGPDPATAQHRALEFLATQLEVRLDVRSVDRQSARIHSKDGEQSVEESQELSTTGRFLVGRSLHAATVEDGLRTEDGLYHVLVALDRAAMRRQEDAVVAGVLEAIGAALDRFRAARSGPVLDADELVGLLLALDEVRNVERSPVGEGIARRWSKEARRLEALAEATLTGLRLEASKRSLQVSLRDQPVAHLPLRLRVSGGLAEGLEREGVTDGRGRLELGLSAVRGRAVKLHVMPVVGPGRLARRVGVELSTLEASLPSDGALEVRLELGELPAPLGRALKKKLARELGLRWDPASPLVGTVELRAPPPLELRGRFSQTVELRVEWAKDALPTQRWVGSGLAETPSEARQAAERSLLGGLD